jgi:mercuric reductase
MNEFHAFAALVLNSVMESVVLLNVLMFSVKEKYYDVFDGLNVELIKGQASFVSEIQLKVNGKVIEADKYIITTGSSPSVPPT